jgi:hypothetical protein
VLDISRQHTSLRVEINNFVIKPKPIFPLTSFADKGIFKLKSQHGYLGQKMNMVVMPKNDIKGPCHNAECHPGLYYGLAAAKALLCTCLTQIKGAEPE